MFFTFSQSKHLFSGLFFYKSCSFQNARHLWRHCARLLVFQRLPSRCNSTIFLVVQWNLCKFWTISFFTSYPCCLVELIASNCSEQWRPTRKSPMIPEADVNISLFQSLLELLGIAKMGPTELTKIFTTSWSRVQDWPRTLIIISRKVILSKLSPATIDFQALTS